ncbi:MAG: TetR/AcrR family transcriptional regulator [Candidimonas sp.]|nr:MAG: TetR/AcrR family transcriptional regulator [Candidimonas sp.]
MGGTNQNNGGTQKKHILEVAARLFAERGFHAIGMTELGEAVHLGRGALYHHIRSKEDLLYEISKEYIVDLAEHSKHVAQTESDPRECVKLLGNYLIDKITTYQPELTVCFREIQSLAEPRRTEVLSWHSQYENCWRDVMTKGAKLGYFRPFDPIALKGILGMYFYSYIWMRQGGRLSPRHIAERLNTMALRALKRDGA